jgi:ribosomal protein L11 methyltransferase
MPYRIDLHGPADEMLDRLVELGALDVASVRGEIAAIIPDGVTADSVARALGRQVRVTPARGRDDDSVWVVHPRVVRVGRFEIVPAGQPAQAGAVRLIDAPAFGSGLHATTALCLECLNNEIDGFHPANLLDVGTGSGILALAALCAGVPRAVAVDTDGEAVRATAANARLNGLTSRLTLLQGGPEAVSGAWPLVVANILAAPLIAMAPTLGRRVGRGGRLIVSGLRASLAPDVEQAYGRVGMRQIRVHTRDGWSALTLHASW